MAMRRRSASDWVRVSSQIIERSPLRTVLTHLIVPRRFRWKRARPFRSAGSPTDGIALLEKYAILSNKTKGADDHVWNDQPNHEPCPQQGPGMGVHAPAFHRF